MAKDLAIILNNGSINSAVVTALAAQRFRLVMLHMPGSAGSEDPHGASARGGVAFTLQTAHFKPYREHLLEIPYMSLLNAVGGPKRAPEAAAPAQQSRLNVLLLELLPLLAAAGRFASHYQAVAIYLGLRVGPEADELAQATEYAQVWQELLQTPCGMADLELSAPLLELEPWQVVDLGSQVNAPFDRTWSCSGDGSDPCWACRGCRSREAAFQRSGRPDPLRAARRS